MNIALVGAAEKLFFRALVGAPEFCTVVSRPSENPLLTNHGIPASSIFNKRGDPAKISFHQVFS